MKWLDKWIERKVDERIKANKKDLERLNQKIKELDAYVTKRSFKLKETIDDVANFLSKIEGAVSVKENIETVMNVSADKDILYLFEQVREDTLAKTRMYNADADNWKDDMIPFKVSTTKNFQYEIPSGLGMSIMAVKFLSGKGYGRYIIKVNQVEKAFFVKRQKGNEDGAILRTRIVFLRENELLTIKQTDGVGSLKCALYVAIAGNRKKMMRIR